MGKKKSKAIEEAYITYGIKKKINSQIRKKQTGKKGTH